MHLRPDWRSLIKRAWSIRFIGFVILVEAISSGWSFLYGSLPISDRWFSAIAMLLAAAAGFSRVVVQKGITPPEKAKPGAGQ